jgi:hypothetical protein
MHISIGAAILILGLLFLATSPAGRKVLAVVFGLAIIAVGGGGFVLYREGQASRAETERVQAVRQACLKEHPFVSSVPSEGHGYAHFTAWLEEQDRKKAHWRAVKECEAPAIPEAARDLEHQKECDATGERSDHDGRRCYDYDVIGGP